MVDEMKSREDGEPAAPQAHHPPHFDRPVEPPPPRMCETHLSVPAVTHCKVCYRLICATCDFAFPGDIHFCPACAVAADGKMSPSRTKMARWSLGLAIGSTASLLTMFLILAALQPEPKEAEAIGRVLGGIPIWASLIGLGLGLASRRRKVLSPVLIKVGISWNAVVLVVWFLMSIFGILMS
jgi:hypothetical protein